MKAAIMAFALCFAQCFTLPATATLFEVMVHVQVTGEVRKPGLYTLPSQSRIADAIQLAGGLKPGASLNTLNLSAAVNDGQAIAVPKFTKPLPPVQPMKKPSRKHHIVLPQKIATGGTVSLNSASIDELDRLPGIGPRLAKDIIGYRTRQGRFRSIEELQEIPGIGEKRFQRLKGHLKL